MSIKRRRDPALPVVHGVVCMVGYIQLCVVTCGTPLVGRYRAQTQRTSNDRQSDMLASLFLSIVNMLVQGVVRLGDLSVPGPSNSRGVLFGNIRYGNILKSIAKTTRDE